MTPSFVAPSDNDIKPEFAIYARVSTDDKGQDVQIQLERCRKYCADMGWTAIEYVDHESAYRVEAKDRPQFNAMMEAIRTHAVQGVVVYQMDRFSRENPLRVSGYLQQITQDHGAVFVSIADGVDSRNQMFPVVERLMAWMANNWSQAHGQRVKAGIARERAKRAKDGQDNRWGRRPIAEARGTPDIDDRALNLRSRGASWSRIAQKLGVGRTTARRLCQKARAKEEDVSGTAKGDSSVGNAGESSADASRCADKRSNRHRIKR
jgi:DNA invertase Pin-like site-specific DNA recombinase